MNTATISTTVETINQKEFVEKFTPLVKRIAYHMMARLPASVQVDDLIQAGMIGLLDAIKRYEGSHGRQFESYAAQRIRGSILDELREADWLPRGIRKKMRQIEVAVRTLEQRMGRVPSEQELATELGIPLTDYQETLQDARGGQIMFYEDFQKTDDEPFFDRISSDSQNDPLEILMDDRLRKMLIKAIADLPSREKMVMGMHYEQEMNLREIGEVVGVSESRVCQLHTQAVVRLRSRLRSL
ncbi:MAG: RNA polymerase sigma factor FliA [Nitrosomonadales bacterium]|nr:MAG: RNA polymerase sigma factor FliA [Nitrosomonadales bacterium]